jgi:hypothetical protein
MFFVTDFKSLKFIIDVGLALHFLTDFPLATFEA